MATRVVENCGDRICRGDVPYLVGEKNKIIYKNGEERGLGKASWKHSSEESSSIGINSDISGNSLEKSGDGQEVQSSYKGPFDSMGTLEQLLPIRRGISKFYNGRSKSFTSLADVSSMKDLAKPDNGFTRRRRSLLRYSHAGKKRLRSNCGGISKRSETSLCRTTLAVAVAMSEKQAEECSESN